MHVSAASIIAVPLAGMSPGPVMTIQHAMLYTSMHLLSHVRSETCVGSTWHNNMGCWPKRSWCEEMSIDNVGVEYLGHRANGVVSMLNVMRPAISCCNLRFGGQCCSDSCSSRQADAPIVQLSEVLPQLATASMISRCSKANPQQAGTKMHTCCAFSMPARSNILTCTSSKESALLTQRVWGLMKRPDR